MRTCPILSEFLLIIYTIKSHYPLVPCLGLVIMNVAIFDDTASAAESMFNIVISNTLGGLVIKH